VTENLKKISQKAYSPINTVLRTTTLSTVWFVSELKGV